MVSSYSLVVFFGIATIIEFFVLKSDLLAPGMLFILSFLVCSMCTWYMADAWDIGEIHMETFEIIIIGSIIFLVIEALVRFSQVPFKKRRRNIKLKPIKISKSILIFEIVLLVFCILWATIIIIQTSGGGTLNTIMAVYKDAINLDAKSLGLPKKILNQFAKVCIALAYILMFVYHNNKAFSKPDKEIKRLNIAIAICFFVFRLVLSGSRQGSLGYLMSWITCSYICKIYNTTHRNLKRTNHKFIRLFMIVVVIIFPAFYFIGRIVGRRKTDVLYAATAYLTTGIYGLEWEVSHNYTTPYWGYTSFGGLFPILKFFGVIPQDLEELSYFPMTWHGNTVSIFGRWYWDFKLIGCCIMIALVSLLFAWLYYKAMRIGKNRNISIIVYCYCINILFFAGYDDFFFNIPTLNTLLIFIIFLILYHYICEKHLSISGRRLSTKKANHE